MSLTGKTIGELALLSGITPNTLFAVELSGVTYHIPYSGMSSSNFVETTYNELYNSITGETLTPGTFYLITDFRTCYDQPDFDYDGSPITTGSTIYKQSSIEPIIVLSTSVSTISVDAYQPTYPNDKIQYDWTFNTTEVTSGTSYGRITERIDEFNNRTDYDHRTIEFKRYRLYTYREELRLNGTIEIFNDGSVSGTNTSFTALTVGDVIYIPSVTPSYYEIIGITGNTSMIVSGDTIGTDNDLSFYKAIEETNNTNGYFSYKRTNVKTDDFIEYTTFGDAINQNFAINNYVGNYTNYYQDIDSGTFILPNNVFLEGEYISNKFGDYCYNNTFGTDNVSNIWGDWCYNNVSTNDIDDNIIGHNFYGNLINTNLRYNRIGDDFYNNLLLSEENNGLQDNLIGNNFNGNTIYSNFYKNEILDNFNSNIIGDFGNLDYFEFYRNYIRNNFNENIIRNNFQNNQIGSNFQQTTANGEFIGNTILNGFNNNTIGDYFGLNNIGNGFNNNQVNDNFYNNTTDYYFYSNLISNGFSNNNIGNYFENNNPTNQDLFGWSNLTTVSTRNYDNFNDAVNNDFHKLLGKELVMRVISTSQYFKIKFTQWTQGENGGGFQYERQEIDSNGNPADPSIIFTKTNNGSEVDVIVPGVVEITRGNQDGIYNIVTESSWDSNVSPQDTEWNSIYTQPNNGESFTNNKIGNNFYNNTLSDNFRYNTIRDGFENNDIGEGFGFGGSQSQGNKIGNYFNNNNIGEYFYNNTIPDNFNTNTIGNNFQWNIVDTDIESIDFTTNYGNISGITYSATGTTATDDTYIGLAGITNGIGVNATFDVEVSGGNVIGVSGNTSGKLYITGNTITILGTQIGGTDGDDDIVITITGVTIPSVYEGYTCNIFKNSSLSNRLSYYDGSDVLTIKNINE